VDKASLKVVAITDPLRMWFTTMAMFGMCVDACKLLDVAENSRPLTMCVIGNLFCT
jgi:hypothetical protein